VCDHTTTDDKERDNSLQWVFDLHTPHTHTERERDVCERLHTHTHTYIHIYIYIYIYIHTHTYIHTYTHTHIHTVFADLILDRDRELCDRRSVQKSEKNRNCLTHRHTLGEIEFSLFFIPHSRERERNRERGTDVTIRHTKCV